MANSILGSLLSKSQTTFVTDTGLQKWKKIFIKSVTIESPTAVTDHPIQSTITEAAPSTPQQGDQPSRRDNDLKTIALELSPSKIIEPVKIRIECYCKTMDEVYALANDYYDNALLINVTSKSVVAKNMVITMVEFEHSPQMTNATKAIISMEQSSPYDTSGKRPEQSADSNVYGLGVVVPSSIDLSVDGLMDTAKSAIGSILSP